MNEGNIDSIIDDLTTELKPVKPITHPAIRVIPFIAGFALYVWLIVDHVGLRVDYVSKLSDLHFLFENSIMALIGLSAGLCASWLCVPDMRGQKWLLGVPFVFLFVFALWIGLRVITEGLNLPSMHFDHCMEDGLWMAAIPAALMVFVSTRGATTRPVLSALMTIMSVTAFAYIGLRFTCMMDTVGHATIYHLAPFVSVGTFFGLFARRIFSW